jgi:hypothetical protein
MDLASIYHQWTDSLVVLSGWTDRMLHLNVGLAIYVSAQCFLRTRRASISALGIVVLFELGNEVLDALYLGDVRIGETLGDAIATLAWPTVFTFMGLYRRRRWNRDQQRLAQSVHHTSNIAILNRSHSANNSPKSRSVARSSRGSLGRAA